MASNATARKRLRWWHIVLICVGGLFVLFMAFGLILQALGYEPEPTAEASSTPSATAVAPSASPTASPTPTAPKATPTPKTTPPPKATPKQEKTPEPADRGTVLYDDIQKMLDAAGDEKTALRMFAVTKVDDEGDYLRVFYQNPIADDADAEDLVREIYGFTTSDAFIDGERNTIVVQDASGRDWNVWVTRNGSLAQFSTSMWG